MKHSRLALLTILALPIPVVAALVSIHCNGVARTNTEPATEEVVYSGGDWKASRANPGISEGQTITSLIVSPATVVGGRDSSGSVYLRYPAPAGGTSVSLNSDNASTTNIPRQVIVPEGKTSAHFPIITKMVKSLSSSSISATIGTTRETNAITVMPRVHREWFVSPNGNAQSDGSQSRPWTLPIALAGGPSGSEVKPGDVVWLREGRYRGMFTSNLQGTPSAPVIVRAIPGDRVVIDKAAADSEKRPGLSVKRSWVWFWGIEITNSNTDRRRISPYSGSDRPWRGAGADVYAPHVKFINMIFHDNGQGIWDKQDMTEVHGCLFFYNGNNKREHALYIGNASGTKQITDNIVFAQGGYGILAHSDSSSMSQKGLHIEGNVVFNNGMLTGDDQKTGNIQVGGVSGVSAERITIKNNHIYNSPANANNKNFGIRLGYEDISNEDVNLVDNFIVSKTPLVISYWQSVNFTGNTIYSTGKSIDLLKPAHIPFSRYRWDFNTYFPGTRLDSLFSIAEAKLDFAGWQRISGLDTHSKLMAVGRPRGTEVFVRPNRYEAGRANVVIYNWDLQDRVGIDLSSVVRVGTEFEVRDAQDYFGAPVAKGTYEGKTIYVPMKLSATTAPIGNVERIPKHTDSEFGVFVVVTKSVKSSF